MSVTLNGTSVKYKIGYEITTEYENKLGSGLIVFPRVAELNIEPLDPVIVDGTYMRVLSYRRKKVRWTPSALYTYDVQLVSPEIMLQRIVLPNRSITQPVIGTKKTIYIVLSQYLELYADDLSLDSALTSLLNVECPEKQWAQPTLYEVFVDLFEVVGLSVKMFNYDTISYYDMNARGDDINEEYIVNEEVTHSATEYASQLDIDIKNAIPDGINARSFQAPKTLDGALLTTNNGKLILEENIEQIESFVALYLYDYGGTLYHCINELTSHIVEKKVYDQSYPSNSPSYVSGNYKRDFLFYEQKNNYIDGLFYTDNTWFPAITPPRAIENILYNEKSNATCSTVTGTWSGGIRDMYFFITYKTVSDLKLPIYKTTTIRNQNTLINSQEEAFIAQNRFSASQRELLNRIGNDEYILYGKYLNSSFLPDVGDTYNNYVITTLKIKRHDTYFTTAMTLTKDFVKKTLYQGLNSRKRYNEYASQRDAFYSNHILKTRYKFVFTDTLFPDTFSIFTLNKYQHDGSNPSDIPYVYFRTYDDADLDISNWVRVHGKVFKHNNSVVYHFKMFNNINVAPSVDDDYNANYISYVDGNAEFVSYDVRMFDGITYANFFGLPTTVTAYENELSQVRNVENSVALSGGLESYYEPYEIFRDDKVLRYKDNREITAETLVMTFESDDNIIVYDKFTELHPMVRYVGVSRTTWKLYISTSHIYDKNSIIGVGTEYDNTYITVTDNELSNDGDMTDAVSWAITDADGNLLIAVNSTSTSIYLGRLTTY